MKSGDAGDRLTLVKPLHRVFCVFIVVSKNPCIVRSSHISARSLLSSSYAPAEVKIARVINIRSLYLMSYIQLINKKNQKLK
jgi:hypothetical protein